MRNRFFFGRKLWICFRVFQMHMIGEKVTFNWFMFRLTLQTDSFAHCSINSNFHAKCLQQSLIRIGNENERSIGDLVNKHPTAFRPPSRATFNDMFRPSDILRRRVADFFPTFLVVHCSVSNVQFPGERYWEEH